MYRVFEFINCYHLDMMMTEPVMNVIGAAICFAMKGNGF
jgi:hypothetical protein